MRQNEDRTEKYNHIKWQYEHLLSNWKALLVKEVQQEQDIMERDLMIMALQASIKHYKTIYIKKTTPELSKIDKVVIPR